MENWELSVVNEKELRVANAKTNISYLFRRDNLVEAMRALDEATPIAAAKNNEKNDLYFGDIFELILNKIFENYGN